MRGTLEAPKYSGPGLLPFTGSKWLYPKVQQGMRVDPRGGESDRTPRTGNATGRPCQLQEMQRQQEVRYRSDP